MIKSMTAFARSEADTRVGVLSWELRSVNHRYAEFSLRLPEELRVLEGRIREQIQNVEWCAGQNYFQFTVQPGRRA